MTLSVVEAKEQLKQAEAAARAGRIEEAAAKLEEVRSRGRELKTELDAIVKAVHLNDGEVAAADRDIAEYNSALATHVATPPDPANFPSAQELNNWVGDLETLKAARDRAVAAKRKLMDNGPDRLRAIALDAELTKLRYAQQNLERVVRGEDAASDWKGGIKVA